MKKSFSLLLALVMLMSAVCAIPSVAFADVSVTGACGDNVFYTYSDNYNTLTISGSGDMYNYQEDKTPMRVAPKTIYISEGVTSIGEYALFQKHADDIYFPDSLKKIEKNALDDVYNGNYPVNFHISSVSKWCSIDKSYSEYCRYNLIADGKLVSDLKIPSDVKSIDRFDFFACQSITSVTIPKSVKLIGAGAFYQCYKLKSCQIPSSVTEIRPLAFSCCTALEKIKVPGSVTEIGEYAFENCHKLQSITLGNGLKEVGQYAFSYCNALKSFTFPESTKTVRRGALCGCFNITTLTVPASMSYYSINNNDSAYGVKKLIITKGTGTMVEKGKDPTNEKTYTMPIWNYTKATLKSVVIKKGVKNIAGFAFSGSNITSISIPSSVKIIGDNAFNSCSKLKSVVIPDGVKTIDKYAFVKCENLEWISLGKDIKNVNSNAFTMCSKLKNVYYNNTLSAFKKIKVDNKYGVEDEFGYANIIYCVTKTSLVSEKKAVRVSWKKINGAAGYEIQLSPDKNFKKNVKTVEVKGNKNFSKKVDKLASKKTYYVRVRAYRGKGNNKEYYMWANKKLVKIK